MEVATLVNTFFQPVAHFGVLGQWLRTALPSSARCKCLLTVLSTLPI